MYSGPVNPAAKRLFEEGMRAYQAEQWGDAAVLFGQAADVGVRNFPLRPEAKIYQCLALLHAKKYNEAYKVAYVAVQDYPSRWELRLVLVEYLLYRQKPDIAAQEVNVALRMAPNQPEVLRAAARTARAGGDLLLAEEYARHAVAIKPDNPSHRALLGLIYTERGRALLAQNDLEASLTTLFGAATYAPESPDPPVLIGKLMLALGRTASARSYALAGRQLVDDPAKISRMAFFVQPLGRRVEPQVHLQLAERHLQQNEPEFAAQEYELAVASGAHDAETWHKLGLLSVRLENNERARQCLYALWLLEGNSQLAGQLEQAIGAPEPGSPPSPGFVERAEIGTAYDAAARRITDAGREIPLNTRVYLTMVFANAVGRHRVRLRVEDPSGMAAIDETMEMEFYGREFSLVRTGTWVVPGVWKATWWMDGAQRSTGTFRLR